MKSVTLEEIDALLAHNPEYAAAERELRPDLNLADDVITLRVGAHLSQAELAALVGTHQANISRLESALANPTLKFLKRVARALGAEVELRLRRLDDVAGAETMERVVRFVETSLDATNTGATTDARWLQWRGQVLSHAADVVVSTDTSRSC